MVQFEQKHCASLLHHISFFVRTDRIAKNVIYFRSYVLDKYSPPIRRRIKYTLIITLSYIQDVLTHVAPELTE